jgi:hypothetical protein
MVTGRRLRALTEVEASISLEILPEPDSFEGHANELEIRRLLDAGFSEAWCQLVATARWMCPSTNLTYVGCSSLGGVSLSCEGMNGDSVRALAEQHAKASELYVDALNDLNESIRKTIQDVAAVVRYLADKPARRALHQAKVAERIKARAARKR